MDIRERETVPARVLGGVPQFRQRFRSGGFVVFETFHVVSCGQHGTKRCFMWFRVASVVLGFHIVSCSQWGFRDTSRGFVWPARYSRCVTWHVVSCGRVAFEMCYVVSCGQLIHAVSCGQRGTPDVSYGTWCRVAEWHLKCFVWPAWYSRCFMWFRVASVVVDMFHVVPCGQRGV